MQPKTVDHLQQDYFNSIKVQLESKTCCETATAITTFQFHKGSIRITGVSNEKAGELQFQFHKGSIRIEPNSYTNVFDFISIP